MLAPDGRVLLLDQLRPPPGCRLDAAVATTFTLGLDAALVPPLAFAAHSLRDGGDPLSVLAAVRECTDRVDVFCQAGMIAVPRRGSALFTFLEPMVHEVQAPPGGLFHPKLWLLRYTGAELPDSYRLLVLSRNLTDDHAWDVALRLDGTQHRGVVSANAPLVALVRSLTGTTTVPLNVERRARVEQLADDARRVVWELPPDVDALSFHVFGVRGQRPAPDFSGYRHLVVSPFLEAEGLYRVSDGSATATVVSRPESFDALPPEALQGRDQLFIVSAVAPTAEEETEGAQGLLDGLHAKVYVVERARRAHVFVGSANATSAAFSRNVEVLVELDAGASKYGVDCFLDPAGSLSQLLEPYAASGGAAPPDNELRWQLENALRGLATRQWRVQAAADGERYQLRVTTDGDLSLGPATSAQMQLLTRLGAAWPLEDGRPADLVFTGVALVDITPFLVLTLRATRGVEVSGMVRAVLTDDPAGRLDAVLAAQVDTPEKFLRFLGLLLGLAGGGVFAALGSGAAAAGSAGGGAGPITGLFESLLGALARKPEALLDLGRLVAQLQQTEQGRAVLPEGFEQLWSVVVATEEVLRP